MQQTEPAATVAMSVLGPIETAGLGVTDAHDHLFLRSPALAGHEFDDPDLAALEIREAQAGGLHSIVEATPIGLGRRPDLLRRVSLETGMPIIAATGYHRDAHYAPGHWVLEASEGTLLERMLVDIEQGMHPADWLDPSLPLDAARAGLIKVGASYQRISAAERRRLEAAAQACLQTGVVILAHTEVGTVATEIIDVLARAGVPVDRIVLAHLDRNPDAELHADIAARGVFLEYDTVGRIKYHPDSVLLDLIEAVATAGHGAQVMLGLDLGRRDYFRAHGGGPGLRYLMATFVPRIEKRLGPATVRQLMVDNPARAFAIRAH